MSKKGTNKPKRRDMNPANEHNWAMLCTHCGQEWFMDETIDLSEGHYEQAHPGETISFSIVWKGIGPAPKGGYEQHRRRR